WRGGVDVARGGEGIREQILRETPLLLERAGVDRGQVRGGGGGFGGPVDDADQTVIKSHQIDGWDGFPLAKWLTELLGWPVALGNAARIDGYAVARAAAPGANRAWLVWRQASEDVAEGICQVVALLCQSRVVIRGGLSLLRDTLFFRPLRKLVAQRVFIPFAD